MKRNLRLVVFAKHIMPLILAGIVLIIAPVSGQGACFNLDLTEGTVDSIIIQKQTASRKHKISLYPDAGQKTLFFGVKGDYGRLYRLFLFDLGGRLIKQSEIRNTQTSLIENIEKGIYFFEIFMDDNRIENGQVIVR